MTVNPLVQPVEPRRHMTLEERCAQANANLMMSGINEERRSMGLFPVRWVIRDHTIKIEAAI